MYYNSQGSEYLKKSTKSLEALNRCWFSLKNKFTSIQQLLPRKNCTWGSLLTIETQMVAKHLQRLLQVSERGTGEKSEKKKKKQYPAYEPLLCIPIHFTMVFPC